VEELSKTGWLEADDYVVNASVAGLSLLRDLGEYSAVAAVCANPADIPGATFVGGGSESEVYRADLAGRDCVIKVVNHAEITEMTERDIFRHTFHDPNYLYKFGNTRRIHQLLAGAPVAPDTFILGEPITEYFAGKTFTAEQFVDGVSIKGMKEFYEQAEGDAPMGGIPKALWDDWYARFDAERTKLQEIFFAAGMRDEIDFNDPDWMITGFDEASSRPVLTLIDQYPALMTRGGDAQTFDDVQYEHFSRLYSEKYRDDPYVAYLRQADTQDTV
jgi:hypothetical protein